MQNFGFYFGVPDRDHPRRSSSTTSRTGGCCRVGGVVIGYVVNYIGVRMMFEPIEPEADRSVHAAGAVPEAAARGQRRASPTSSPARSSPSRTSATSCCTVHGPTAPTRCCETVLRAGGRQGHRAGQGRRAGRHRHHASTTASSASLATRGRPAFTSIFSDAEFNEAQADRISVVRRRRRWPRCRPTTSPSCSARPSTTTSGCCSSTAPCSASSPASSTSRSSECERDR